MAHSSIASRQSNLPPSGIRCRQAPVITHPQRPRLLCHHATAVDHLVMTVDGFNAGKAQELYPSLQQMQRDSVQPALDVITGLLPQRILGSMLTQHPHLLSVDMGAWVDFLTAFGFEEGQIKELLRSSPETFYNSNIFQAGQLVLFLRQDLQLPPDAVMKHFKWAAVLRPGATQASMQTVTQALQQHLGHTQDPQQLLQLLQAFPEVLGWDFETDLLPKLQFFESLGQPAQRLLAGALWDADSSWLPGLRSWHYSVAPKLQLLADLLGSEEQAQELVSRCPTVLKLPVESKLQPILSALTALGLDGDQLARLLRGCPKLLAESKDELVSRINFLLDAIGATAEDLLLYPGYALLSLSDVIGPRYYFLARHPGWLDAFSDPLTGNLQLRRVMESSLDAFLTDVTEATGSSRAKVERDYQEMHVEWANLLGWCCDKAFSDLDQVNSMYQEQVNLFYVLVQ